MTATKLISIVVPVFNEAEVLTTLIAAIEKAIKSTGMDWEVIFVNDGSRDQSPEILDKAAAADPHLKVVHLSRNFGHQAAVHCGLTFTTGDAVIVMDSDMQDSPDAIIEFISKWQEGFEVVYAIRTNRKESGPKKILFHLFYRLLSAISAVSIPHDAGNFGLIDRRVCDLILSMNERDRYYSGLRSWVGFKQTGIKVERGARYDDHPRVSLLGLLNLARNAIFSFSTIPITIFYLIALVSLCVSIMSLAFTLGQKFFTNWAVPGWTSTLSAIAIFGFINSLGIAVLGEYIWRIYQQVRERPMFIVNYTKNIKDQKTS